MKKTPLLMALGPITALVILVGAALLEHASVTPVRAAGQILCVQSGAPATGAPCSNSTAYGTIQAAVVAATPGDEIRVATGTYTSSGTSVVAIASPITIAGGYTGGASGWSTAGLSTGTVIDGQGARFGLEVQGATTVTLRNLAIDNGGINNASGTVSVPTSALNLRNGGASNGAFAVAAGAAVVFPTGAHTLAAGTSFAGTGKATVAGGTVTLGGNVNAENLDVTGGTLTGTGDLVVSGVFTWTGGTVSGTGTATVSAGGALALSGFGQRFLDTRNLTLAGTTTWSGPGVLFLSSGAVVTNSGTFDIQGDATLQWLGSGAQSRFVNTGTLTKSGGAGTTLFYAVPITNDGAISLLSGTLNTNSAAYTQGATGSLGVSIGGPNPGVDFGRLTVGGVATLGGSLNLSTRNG